MSRAHSTELDRILRDEGRKGSWLAQQVGVDERRVSFWRHGRHVPEPSNQLKIAQALGRSVEELFGCADCTPIGNQ